MNEFNIISLIFASLLSFRSFAQSKSTSSSEVVDHSINVSDTSQAERKSIVKSLLVFEGIESCVTVYAVPESIKILSKSARQSSRPNESAFYCSHCIVSFVSVMFINFRAN